MTLGNDKQLCISHLGTAKLPSSYSPLVLHQVYHTPKISNNLISVTKLCSDNKVFVEFYVTHFLIKDQVSKRVLFQGQLDKGLYKVQSSCSFFTVSFPPRVFIANIKDPNMWHKKLGRPALSIVNQILDSCNIARTQKIRLYFCNSCQLAKSHRLSFSLSPSIAVKLFELIHTNLWGPSLVRFISGARYFLLFIDDHTRFTWFYLLKTKCETYPTFLKFQALIENQFNTKIKVFQSDWGGEFRYFSILFSNLGIVHRLSCSYTSQ